MFAARGDETQPAKRFRTADATRVDEQAPRRLVRSCSECESLAPSLSLLCARYRAENEHALLLDSVRVPTETALDHMCWRNPCPACGTVSLAEAYVTLLSEKSAYMSHRSFLRPCAFCEKVARMIYVDKNDDLVDRLGFTLEELTKGHTIGVEGRKSVKCKHSHVSFSFTSLSSDTDDGIQVYNHNEDDTSEARWAEIARLELQNDWEDVTHRPVSASGTCWCKLANSCGMTVRNLCRLSAQAPALLAPGSSVTLFIVFKGTRKCGKMFPDAMLMKRSTWTPCRVVHDHLLLREQILHACASKYGSEDATMVARAIRKFEDMMMRQTERCPSVMKRQTATAASRVVRRY